MRMRFRHHKKPTGVMNAADSSFLHPDELVFTYVKWAFKVEREKNDDWNGVLVVVLTCGMVGEALLPAALQLVLAGKFEVNFGGQFH